MGTVLILLLYTGLVCGYSVNITTVHWGGLWGNMLILLYTGVVCGKYVNITVHWGGLREIC